MNVVFNTIYYGLNYICQCHNISLIEKSGIRRNNEKKYTSTIYTIFSE